MRRTFMTTAIFSLACSTIASADTSEISAFGEGLCQTVLTEGVDGIDGAFFQGAIDSHGIDAGDFCSCVGDAFVIHADHQMDQILTVSGTDEEAEVMQAVIEDNLHFCLPLDDGTADIGLDPFHPDYDLSEDIPEEDDEATDGDLVDFGGLGYDPVDARTCVDVIRGDFPARGFDSKRINTLIRRGNLDISEICTCTAVWMVAQGEPLQEAIAGSATPGAEWGTALGRGIEACIGG